MNHKLPGIAELIQTNMQIYREQPLSLLPSKGTVPIAFALLSSGWHACTLASTDTDIVADESKAPAAWEQVGVLTVAAPLPAAIQLLGTHSYVLITDDQGEPVGYLDRPTVLRAVFTSYEILEAYFETMIQTMDASISVIDEKARVMVWTEGAERIFSLKAKDIVGRPITDFFPLDMLETLKSLHNGQSLYRHQHQPREDLVVLINTKPIYLHDTIIGAVAAETDITSQVRLNQELLKANK
ncbi:PAS domain-containing protein, partial [Mesorhizobium sp. M00.F.Ca.ET.186.01.1.1]